MSITADDWSQAETLAAAYLKAEKNVSAPVSFYRNLPMPFLLGAWWTGPDGKEAGTDVLVYGGKVQTERGIAALRPYFEFLGEQHLRALSVSDVEALLQALGPYRPAATNLGAPWQHAQTYQDLFPAIVNHNGVLKYVVHYVQVEPGGPGSAPGSGSRPPGPLVLQRWSLQLFPVAADLNWKFEERVERPSPPVVIP